MQKTQRERIKEYLMRGKTITQLKALRKFKCLRLSSVIFKLRHNDGIPINMHQPELEKGKLYAEYWIDRKWLDEHVGR